MINPHYWTPVFADFAISVLVSRIFGNFGFNFCFMVAKEGLSELHLDW